MYSTWNCLSTKCSRLVGPLLAKSVGFWVQKGFQSLLPRHEKLLQIRLIDVHDSQPSHTFDLKRSNHTGFVSCLAPDWCPRSAASGDSLIILFRQTWNFGRKFPDQSKGVCACVFINLMLLKYSWNADLKGRIRSSSCTIQSNSFVQYALRHIDPKLSCRRITASVICLCGGRWPQGLKPMKGADVCSILSWPLCKSCQSTNLTRC